jgi:hypothetical protein
LRYRRDAQCDPRDESRAQHWFDGDAQHESAVEQPVHKKRASLWVAPSRLGVPVARKRKHPERDTDYHVYEPPDKRKMRVLDRPDGSHGDTETLGDRKRRAGREGEQKRDQRRLDEKAALEWHRVVCYALTAAAWFRRRRPAAWIDARSRRGRSSRDLALHEYQGVTIVLRIFLDVDDMPAFLA